MPDVKVVVPVATSDNASSRVTVPATLLTVSAATVLAFDVIVPVPTMVAVKAVYVPAADKFNELKFRFVVPSVKAVVPKFNVSNQLPVVSVSTAAPDPVKVK